MTTSDLPVGSAPVPVPIPHFPDALHAVVWRNWSMVPLERLARILGAEPAEIAAVGHAMGLTGPMPVSVEQWRRSALTVIRRNWHLLPYEQLLELLEWTPEELAYSLQEDDFLYIKLGSLKPACDPVRYVLPTLDTIHRAAEIAAVLAAEGVAEPGEGELLFHFVQELSAPLTGERAPATIGGFSPRFCHSYFALFGDPLLATDADPYPDGYLARLAASGVDGVWLQAVLYKLAPYPWQPELSDRYEERLANLRALVARAKSHGIGIYLYLNEPRSMPLSFFEAHPELRGVVSGDHASVCTSVQEVRDYLTQAVASIARAAPGLAGFFTITASENMTNCWSHGRGKDCPRCGTRSPGEVIAEVNGAFQAGLDRAATGTRLIAWDWGWADSWAAECIERLPDKVTLQSVSEWSIPIHRGGVDSMIGEYSISEIGPGPRAARHWALARQRGLPVTAKIQANITWELSAVPYIPAVENVAQHIARLREAGVDGLMLGWSLGGYPSPNLEVVAAMGQDRTLPPDAAMHQVAEARYGAALAPAVVAAWRQCSQAFGEFPYHIETVYKAPLQFGPANLLFANPTGYRATMIGFPYDDLNGWRAVYPSEIFSAQLTKVADGFDAALRELQGVVAQGHTLASDQRELLEQELRLIEVSGIHFRTVANQTRFVVARDALASATPETAPSLLAELSGVLRGEIELARALAAHQRVDSTIGFEASNQYYYVGEDLQEKIVNCRHLLDRWLPAERARLGVPA